MKEKKPTIMYTRKIPDRETMGDIADNLVALAGLCDSGELTPCSHDYTDYAARIRKVIARERRKPLYVLTEIKKTNHPCTEPQDVTNWVFDNLARARSLMRGLYDNTPDQETNEFRKWDAFKNSDDFETIWTIKKVVLS